MTPGGLSDGLPGLHPSPRGSPFAHTLPGLQDTPLQRPGLVRPPAAPARPRAGGAPDPDPSPGRPARERDQGGDGDWAAARGRVLGGETRRPLSFSAPAPLSPPSELARRRPRSALSPRLFLLPYPRTLSPPLPRPLLSPPPPRSALSSSSPELPAGPRESWLRGGVTESPGLGKAARSETPSRGWVSGRRRTPRALREGEPASRARGAGGEPPTRVLAEPLRPAETWLRV